MGAVFTELFEAMRDSTWERIDFGQADAPEPDVAVNSWRNAHVTDRMRERIRQAHKDGDIVIYGELSSEADAVESFFCCESFELGGEGLYINALEATW
ncbi:MAG: hypothetical protein HONBIEJF_02556 [Fimbriimonadaceae bacterium]|nr:hypothetical protein [Fimbriimonadaceae bacterium]